MQIFRYDVTDSTNEEARRYGCTEAPSLPALFIAESQTAGRGRMGRSFYSPGETGLYASLLIEAPDNAERLLSLTALAAVAAMQTLREKLNKNVLIKWVNDLYLDGKKVAGILAESFVSGGRRLIVLGIGINLSTAHFPDELIYKAGSLSTDLKLDTDEKCAIARDISERLIAFLERDSIAYAMKLYRERSCVIGRRIYFLRDGRETYATATDVTDTGGLCVRLDSGEDEILTSGEISIFLN